MEEIIAYFGDGFLQMAGGILVFWMVFASVREGGVLFALVQSFMTGLCG